MMNCLQYIELYTIFVCHKSCDSVTCSSSCYIVQFKRIGFQCALSGCHTIVGIVTDYTTKKKYLLKSKKYVEVYLLSPCEYESS